ncbi:hypothetical protein NECAME_10033 [Necator americanus]|uniref:glucuronosyltransferase n=1 Tax=Necator americanus TaxID=51031 RepID=W2TD15_NECAM|nr:hypothetical protein NECAME_10033 [Necator americanus]ETN79086.1 hypothetical protein NECAME_10033 [Necator americanus]
MLLAIIVAIVGVANSAKVLLMPSILYPMHGYTMKHLADELVRRKHDVTWLEYGPTQSKISLKKGVRRLYWPVQFDDQTLTDIYVHRNHSSHSHPKCRVHISHGGLNSVIESVWHGVPTIGVPLTVAGYDNFLRISARGAGLLITKDELSQEKLLWALKEIRRKTYKDEMLVFQDMLRDVPYSELTHAAFWVEFIERHQEVPHARSGADKLNVFQYFLIDVILFMISVLLLFFATVYFVIRTVFRVTRYVITYPFNKSQTLSAKQMNGKKKN